MTEPPPCLPRRYFQKTRRGKVLRVVRERYLRDDLGFGTVCSSTTTSGSVTRLLQENELLQTLRDEHLEDGGRPLLLVVDTNIILRQLTALESSCPAVKNLVLCETVLNETKKRDLSSRNRLLALLKDGNRTCIAFPNENHQATYDVKHLEESDNDYNDRLVRRAARYFASRLASKARVVLLTDDVDNLAKLRAEEKESPSGVTGMRMVEFAQSLSSRYPRFIDHVAVLSSSAKLSDLSSRPAIFPEHLAQADLEKGLRSGKFYQGTLRTARYPRLCTDEDEGSVLVQGLEGKDEPTRVSILGFVHLNRAIDGDRVVVELLPKEVRTKVVIDAEGNEVEETIESADPDVVGQVKEAEVVARTGKIVGIIRKNWRACVGTLVEEAQMDATEPVEEAAVNDDEEAVAGKETTVTFIPMDVKFPNMIVRTRQMASLKKERVIVQMDGWDRRSQYPTAHLVRSLGEIGDKETETACTLFEHDIPTAEFSTAVLACLPKSGKNWHADEESPFPDYRVDLRGIEQVCSVDPPGCKDIDDALHARPSPNHPDRLEVGVHIADVSHFVLPGTAIDIEARNRGTSTYLVERRLDMLPGLLTTDICSLVGHKDRFCFSVTWETNQDGTEFFGEPKFFKSVIRSRGALTYDEAQAFIVDPNARGVTADSIRALNRVAKTLRARRIANGALTLASQEVRFELDAETQDPTDVKRYVQKDAHLMVEEFMLLANCAVAERIEQAFPKRAVLRRHPKPSRELLDQLVRSAAAADVHLDVSSSKALADSLDRASKPDQPFFNQLLRIMTTRAMQQANYFCSGYFESRADYLHYGLAVPVYTHFTSPIRRYADLVVHRMLGAALGLHPLYEGYEKKEDVKAVTDNLNRRHRNAQKAGRASSALHTVVLFRNKPPVETDAFISGISSSRVNVMIPEYGLEEVLTGMDHSTGFQLNEENFTLVRPATNERYHIFDRIRVKLFVETIGPAKRQRLVIEFIDSKKPGSSTKRAADDEVAGSSKKKVKASTKEREEAREPTPSSSQSKKKKQKLSD